MVRRREWSECGVHTAAAGRLLWAVVILGALLPKCRADEGSGRKGGCESASDHGRGRYRGRREMSCKDDQKTGEIGRAHV